MQIIATYTDNKRTFNSLLELENHENIIEIYIEYSLNY